MLSDLLGIPVQLDSDPAEVSARIADPELAAKALGKLSRSGVAVSEFALGQPSLDEVFLALTGRPAAFDQGSRKEDAA